MPPSQGTVSFDELDRMFRKSLLSYFSRRIRESAIAEDMVQQVFERLLKRGNMETIDHLSGYVFQTASSVMADYLRKNERTHRNAHEIFDEHRHAGVDFSPDYVLEKRERLAQARAILETLPERTRMIFVLRRLEGMKYRDIADRFGISVSAVEKHMERAIARLAKGMEP